MQIKEYFEGQGFITDKNGNDLARYTVTPRGVHGEVTFELTLTSEANSGFNGLSRVKVMGNRIHFGSPYVILFANTDDLTSYEKRFYGADLHIESQDIHTAGTGDPKILELIATVAQMNKQLVRKYTRD